METKRQKKPIDVEADQRFCGMIPSGSGTEYKSRGIGRQGELPCDRTGSADFRAGMRFVLSEYRSRAESGVLGDCAR